ncbi:MAG: hypothetical protein LBG09_02945, partial [Puniceicoccales bacterium]|nr:hypothetical protein [Puniceicoccales bacterium]
MAIKVDPKEFQTGTLGAMAPDLTNPTDPRNNPFNRDKALSFMEVEMVVGDGDNAPIPKPKDVKNPGNIPSAFSLGVSTLQEFTPPQVTKAVVNDLFPSISEPVIGGAPVPRKSAIDSDFSTTVGALPALVLGPIDKTLTADDGPGYSELQFKTPKPEAPKAQDRIWPDADKKGLSAENVQWLTFLAHDRFFSDTEYQVNGTNILTANTSLRSRLTDPTLQNENSIWQSTTEDFFPELVFAPDLGGRLSWAEIVAYVNYYMVHDYCDATKATIWVEGNGSDWKSKIILDGELSDDEKVIRSRTTPLEYLKKLVEAKTSILLYKDKISAIELGASATASDQESGSESSTTPATVADTSLETISYNIRKVLGAFFTQKIYSEYVDSETYADILTDDLLKIGIVTTLKAIGEDIDGGGQNRLDLDDAIKDRITGNIQKYFDGTLDKSAFDYRFGTDNNYPTVKTLAGQIFRKFSDQGICDINDEAITLNAIKSEICDLFNSLVADIVLKEAQKYKLQCQISKIDFLTAERTSNPLVPDGVRLANGEDSIEGDDFKLLQTALNYVKSQLILLKNENHLPEKLVAEDFIIDGKPIEENSQKFQSVMEYLKREDFDIRRYIDGRIRKPIAKAIRDTLASNMGAAKVRDAIKEIFPMPADGSIDRSIQGKREDLRYALSSNFLPDLENYILNRLLNPTTQSIANSDLIAAIIAGDVRDVDIKNWIIEGVNSFLTGGGSEAVKTELAKKYSFIESEIMRGKAEEVIGKLLKIDDSYGESDSPLIRAIGGQISEETFVLANKDKIEAQLQDLQLIIAGKKAVPVSSGLISSTDPDMEKFLEYAYAKILKDLYEPIIYNDFVKYTKILGGWFSEISQNQNRKNDIYSLLKKKIEELRASYGKYYDAIQNFPLHGASFFLSEGSSTRHPKLENQYDLFAAFFNPDLTKKSNSPTLNIAALLDDYIGVYEKYGKKCYAEKGKYEISDYSVELMNLLERHAPLEKGDDIFVGAILQGIRDEQIALKRELEAIDLYIEYKRAENFRTELRQYLLDELIENWRLDEVQRQVLITKIYTIAVDKGIMRESNGVYTSGVITIGQNGEKEYDENAGSYLYAKGIAEYLRNGYNVDQDIAVPVAEILRAIDAYKTAELYDNEALFSQFKRLLSSESNIRYTDGTSLFSLMTKYVASDKIDLSLLTLFAGVYSPIKSDTYVPVGVNALSQRILDDAAADVKAKMVVPKDELGKINETFFTFLNSAEGIATGVDEEARYAALVNFLNGLQTSLAGTFSNGGSYAYMVNRFIAAYNALAAGLKGISGEVDTLAKDSKTAAMTCFATIKDELQTARTGIQAVLTGTSRSEMGGGTNWADFENAIGDLTNVLNYVEVTLLLESLQKAYPNWYSERSPGSDYGNLLNYLKNFTNGRPEMDTILKKLIGILEGDDVRYSLVSNLDQKLLPLLGSYEKSDEWDNFKGMVSDAAYDIDEKFEAYAEQFTALKDALGELMSSASPEEVINKINSLTPIASIKDAGEWDNNLETNAVNTNHAVFQLNTIAEAHNEIVTKLKNISDPVQAYLSALKNYNIALPDDDKTALIAAFHKVEEQFLALEQTITAHINGLSSVDVGGVANNKLTSAESIQCENVLQSLLNLLQHDREMMLSGLLTKLYPNWNADFASLKELRTELKNFIAKEELGESASGNGNFTITKADCLRLLDAIDAAAHQDLGDVSYHSNGDNLKSIVDGGVATKVPEDFMFQSQDSQFMVDMTNVEDVFEKLNVTFLDTFRQTIANIATDGSSLDAAISAFGAIDPRQVLESSVLKTVPNCSTAYDRSRWLTDQFVAAYDTIVDDFKYEDASDEKFSYKGRLSSLAAYKTALDQLSAANADLDAKEDILGAAQVALSDAQTKKFSAGTIADRQAEVDAAQAQVDAAKTAVIGAQGTLLTTYTQWANEYNSWVNRLTQEGELSLLADDGIYKQLQIIVKSLQDINSKIGDLTETSGNNLLTTADTPDWTHASLKTDLSVDGTEITLNGRTFYLKKFEEGTKTLADVFYIAQSGTGADAIKTFLKRADIENLQSLVTAQISFYNSIGERIKGSIAQQLSPLAMYRGNHYAIPFEIDNANTLLGGILDATNFGQLLEKYVFHREIAAITTVDTEGEVQPRTEARVVGDSIGSYDDYDDTIKEAVRVSYRDTFFAKIHEKYSKILQDSDGDDSNDLKSVAKTLSSAVSNYSGNISGFLSDQNVSAGIDNLGGLLGNILKLFGDASSELEAAMSGTSVPDAMISATETLTAAETGLPDEITLALADLTNAQKQSFREELDKYGDQILANFRCEVVNKLQGSFKIGAPQNGYTKDSLQRLRALLCAIKTGSGSDTVYLFSDNHGENPTPYIFSDESGGASPDPFISDLVGKIRDMVAEEITYPASVFFASETNFDYDTWLEQTDAAADQETIDELLEKFKTAFKDLTLDLGWETDGSVNWTDFWNQTIVPQDSSLGDLVSDSYNSLNDIDRKAFQYLFLKALDETQKDNFSSKNIVQLLAVLKSFDRYCLKLKEGAQNSANGFLHNIEEGKLKTQATNFDGKLEALVQTSFTEFPPHPASDFFAKETGFNYDAWDVPAKKDTKIDIKAQIGYFGMEWATMNLQAGWETNSLVNWNEFWNSEIFNSLCAFYNDLTTGDDRKAFQYLFLKALDETQKTNFSSNNIAQLRAILDSFDRYCLGIKDSDGNAGNGFLSDVAVDAMTPTATDFNDRLEALVQASLTELPPDPASSFFASETNFDYDAWNKTNETIITNNISIFTTAFENLPLDPGWETDESVNWSSFWNSEIFNSLCAFYNDLTTGDDRKAFQYLFLKALDETQKDNFSSNNIAQLRAILDSFDEHVLEIPAIGTSGSEWLGDTVNGFLRSIESGKTESAATALGTRLEALEQAARLDTVYPASDFFENKTAFDYSAWLTAVAEDTSANGAAADQETIDELLEKFTTAFRNLALDLGWETDGSVNWSDFWSTETDGGPLGDDIKNNYASGFMTGNDGQKAFQYLFLKALDETQKDNFSSNNIVQLRAILDSFDTEVLEITGAVGEAANEEINGFLRSTVDDTGISVQATAFSRVLDDESQVKLSPINAYFTENIDAIFKTDLAKYPDCINDGLDVSDVDNLEKTENNYENIYKQHVWATYAHGIFLDAYGDTDVVSPMDAFDEALENWVQSIRANGYLASSDTEYATQQLLFTALKNAYGTLCAAFFEKFPAPTTTLDQAALEALDVPSDKATALASAPMSTAEAENIFKKQVRELLRSKILGKLCESFIVLEGADGDKVRDILGDSNLEMALDTTTIASVLNDPTISGTPILPGDTSVIFDSSHPIFGVLDVLTNTAADSLSTKLSPFFGEIQSANDALKAIFSPDTTTDFQTALAEFTNIAFSTVPTLDSIIAAAEPWEKIMIKDRLELAAKITAQFTLLQKRVKLYMVQSVADYNALVTPDLVDEEAWKTTTVSGVLSAIDADIAYSPDKLETLRSFSKNLNAVLGQAIVPDKAIVPDEAIGDPEVAAAMEALLNYSKTIEKLLLLNVLQKRLGDSKGLLDSDTNKTVREFLYNEPSAEPSEGTAEEQPAITYTIAAFSSDGGQPGLKGLLESSATDITNINTSFTDIYATVSSEIDRVYRLNMAQRTLLGLAAQQSACYEALRTVSEEMFAQTPAFDASPLLSLEPTDELDVDKLKTETNSSEAESLGVLVKFYNAVVKFFSEAGTENTSNVVSAIETKITAYNANPSANATALQESLKGASVKALLTVFENIFNESDSTRREVLLMIHEQLRAKIDAAIDTWRGLYLCTTDSTTTQPTNSINGQAITWGSDQITAHNKYVNYLIENLYRFGATTCLGIFSSGNENNAPTREEIAQIRKVLGHWEDLETSERLCEKYLPGDSGKNFQKLQELLYQAYIDAKKDSGEPSDLEAIFQAIYAEDAPAAADFAAIRSNLAGLKFETPEQILEAFENTIHQCLGELYTIFQNFSQNNGANTFTELQPLPLDSLLYDVDPGCDSLKLMKIIVNFTSEMNTAIGDFNSKLQVFTEAPTAEKLQAVDAAYGAIITKINAAITQVKNDSNLNSEKKSKFENYFNKIAKVFEDAWPQYYLLLLEKLYPNLATSTADRTGLQNAYSTEFVSPPDESIEGKIKKEIVKAFADFGKGETLQKYYHPTQTRTFGDTLISKVGALNANVSQLASTRFQELTNVQNGFKALNQAIWNLLREKPISNLLGNLNDLIADDLDTASAEAAKNNYEILRGIYDEIKAVLTDGSLFRTNLTNFLASPTVSEDSYAETKVSKALTGLIGSVSFKLTNLTDVGSILDMLKAFNTACLALFLQKKYPQWNSDGRELDTVRTELKVALDLSNTANSCIYTCGTKGNIDTFKGKIKLYQGDMKVADPRLYYFDNDVDNPNDPSDVRHNRAHRVNDEAWLYRKPADNGGCIQYDVVSSKQYIKHNDQYFELAEQEVAFITISPEQHVRILAPTLMYDKQDGQLTPRNIPDDTALHTDAKTGYVLGEDGKYYNVARYPLKYKVHNNGHFGYVDYREQNGTRKELYYKAIHKEYAEVAQKDLPSMDGALANDRDYFIYVDDGVYCKADDVYTKYYYKEAELANDATEEEKAAAEGTYYKIVGTKASKYVLENGDEVDNTVQTFYRSTQKGKKFFGMRLYQWGVGVEYVTRDDENLMIPVTYERYVRSNATEDGFTQEGQEVYVYSDILKKYVLVGSADNYYFAKNVDGEEKEFRIEFPDRRYVEKVDGSEYLYVPHPETKYEKSGQELVQGLYVCAGGKYLKIKVEETTPVEKSLRPKIAEEIAAGINVNADYVQAVDGGYYPLSSVKIKTTDGDLVPYPTGTGQDLFKDAISDEVLAINNWQSYALEGVSYNNLFIADKTNRRLVHASENTTDAPTFVTPVKDETGTYVYADDGIYYDIAAGSTFTLYADYQLGSDTGACQYLDGDTLQAVENPLKRYAFRIDTYYEIKNAGANDNVMGSRYIEIGSSKVVVNSNEEEYVKLNGGQGNEAYKKIKGIGGEILIKRAIVAGGGISGLSGVMVAVTSNGTVVSKVSKKEVYATKEVQIEMEGGKLCSINDAKVYLKGTPDTLLGDAVDKTGKINIFVKNQSGDAVRVSKLSERYEVAENEGGDYIKLDGMYYSRRNKDLTIKVKYKNDSESLLSKALDNNDPRIEFYVDREEGIRVQQVNEDCYREEATGKYYALKTVTSNDYLAAIRKRAGDDNTIGVGDKYIIKDDGSYQKIENLNDSQRYNLHGKGSGLFKIYSMGVENNLIDDGSVQFTQDTSGMYYLKGGIYYKIYKITTEAEKIIANSKPGGKDFALKDPNKEETYEEYIINDKGSCEKVSNISSQRYKLTKYAGINQNWSTKAVKAGNKFYDLAKFQLVVKRNGTLNVFNGGIDELKSSNEAYMAPYVVPMGVDLGSYGADRALKVEGNDAVRGDFGLYEIREEIKGSAVTAGYSTEEGRGDYIRGVDGKLYSVGDISVRVDGGYKSYQGLEYIIRGWGSEAE